MNLREVLSSFDDFTNASENVPVLRQLILASMLGESMASEQAQLRATALRKVHELISSKPSSLKKPKHSEPLQAVLQSDLPFIFSDIPTSLFERLGNIASIEKGYSPIQKTRPGQYPLVVTAENRSSSYSYEFEGPATIIPLVSSTGHGHASLKRLHYQEGKFAVGNILAVIQPLCPDHISARFFFEYLSAFKEELLVSKMVGTANVTLTISQIAEIPVPMVSGPSVERMVETMALCDQLESELKCLESAQREISQFVSSKFLADPSQDSFGNLFHQSFSTSPNHFRNTVVSLAIKGKLIAQDPSDQPVEDLLSENDERRRQIADVDHRADKENQILLSKGDRWNVPETWSWRGLADLVLFVDYRGKTPTKQTSGVKLITAKNVRRGHLSLSPEEFLTEKEYSEWMTRGFPKPGDVLFTTEAPMGNAAIVELTDRFALAQRVICFQIYGALDPCFLVLQILSQPFQEILEKNATGMTAKGIKGSRLKKLPIAIPPLAEQHRIVGKVNELMGLIDRLDSELKSSTAMAAKLMIALAHDLTNVKLYGKDLKGIIQSRTTFIHPAAFLAAEITDRLHDHNTFGQTKLQKVLYLAEYYFHLREVDSTYTRYQRGPHDEYLIARVEDEMRRHNWFDAQSRETGKGWHYPRLDGDTKYREFTELQWPDKVREIRDFVDFLRTWKSEDCEMFATLFAAWNDLILWRKSINDEAIIDEVFYNWHPDKQKISKPTWEKMLKWMKDKGYVPTGYGKPTRPLDQPRLNLE